MSPCAVCRLAPPGLSPGQQEEIQRTVRTLGRSLGVVGLLNVQLAVTPDGEVSVLEANPRASRTIPFVSKATGVPLAKAAARIMAGASIEDLRAEGILPQGTYPEESGHVAVKEAVLPFDRVEYDEYLSTPRRDQITSTTPRMLARLMPTRGAPSNGPHS